uniref:Glyco_trans_2-like domain-containing protein n=1 Tax=Strongyloides papillosus TaxID=174720 RepID=A0A0N5BQ73_STREA
MIYFYYQYHLIFDEITIEYDLSTNNVSFLSEVENKSIPVLWKHPLVSHINCGALLNGDSSYIMKESKELKKLKYLPNTFSTLCEDIKKRGHYPDKPLSQEEADFPIAYIRTIYTDYLTLEYQFLLTYAPQNYYCFIIDKKQPAHFHNKIYAMANCFKNVHIIQNRYQMNSRGFNVNSANYDCMRYLNDKNYKYVVVLNNDDMPLKTNRELVEIFKIYNGSIDIEYADPRPFYDRVDFNLNWSLGHLEIFKEGDPRKLDNKILSSQLEFQKGYNAIFYPKETVKYFVEELNLTKFFKQLDDMNLYANDEFGFQSLIANEYLNIPGRIDADCLKKDYFFKDSYMTRYVKWIFDGDCDESETRHYDYLTLEYQFLLTYAPQNYYCFIIDKKQPAHFHNKIYAMANCFKNVHIIQNRYQMNSRGFNVNSANYDCMRYLNDKNYKYVVVLNVSFLNIILFFQLLQNDDMPLKTNRELVEIFKIYNGSIDIEYADPRPFYDRVDFNLNWSLGHLEIFKEGDPRKLDNKILSSQLEFQKGYVTISYPKKTVKYLVEELNLTKFFKQLDDMKLYANDEIGFQSLIANEYLNIPGRIDSDCLKKDYFFKDSYMTRYVKWFDSGYCDRNETRHYICLHNIKTLHSIKKVPHLSVNKFKGEFDFGGLTCWVEYMYNRTYFEHYKPINKSFYENLSLVKYGNLKNHIKDKEQLCEMSRSNN